MMASPPLDPEKELPVTAIATTATTTATTPSISESQTFHNVPTTTLTLLTKITTHLKQTNEFETRGIARVLPQDRQPPDTPSADLQIFLLWFGANISVNNLAVGLLGPLVFGLGFLDSALCALFGALLGSLSTGYMSVWGPASGCRTMVVLRYFMGWWPSKLVCVLNIVLMVGYISISAVIGGQMLSAVSPGGVSIAVGIVVVEVVILVVAVFGMRAFHAYERYAWLPQLMVLFVLVGCAGPYFDVSLQSTTTQLAASRISFLSLCLYAPASWVGAASDFYVYYPERTSKVKVFLLTCTGLWLSFTFVFMLAIGLATGMSTHQGWADASAVSTGALIVSAFQPLGDFGRFCAVIVALGLIANSTPGTYAAALGFQVLGRYPKKIPRWAWTCVVVVLELVLALAGREHLFVILQNFLALMGYWTELMVCIVAEEHFFFRRGKLGFDWTRWEDKSYLPVGWAALVAFLLGWVGSVLGMYQIWYVGPLAEKAGLADIGMWVGSGFALVVFPPLRYLELRLVGR